MRPVIGMQPAANRIVPPVRPAGSTIKPVRP
jgi:hypothetical protein